MSKCDISIQYDKQDRRFAAGDTVTGQVTIAADAAVTCRGVTITQGWRTHGRGNRHKVTLSEVVHLPGNLDPDRWTTIDFAFTVPAGPPTYHGRNLTVEHFISVRIDVPWKFDPKGMEDYHVTPVMMLIDPQPKGIGSKMEGDVARIPKTPMFIGIGLLVFGMFVFTPFSCILIPIAFALLSWSLRQKLAFYKLGDLKASIGATQFPPGGHIPIEFTFAPNKLVPLNGVTARLVGQERVISGSGTNRTTHTFKIHDQTAPLAGARQLPAGQTTLVRGTLQIPDTQAYSFSCPDNYIVWDLTLRVDIPMWPDWTFTERVQLLPGAWNEPVPGGAIATTDQPHQTQTPAQQPSPTQAPSPGGGWDRSRELANRPAESNNQTDDSGLTFIEDEQPQADPASDATPDSLDSPWNQPANAEEDSNVAATSDAQDQWTSDTDLPAQDDPWADDAPSNDVADVISPQQPAATSPSNASSDLADLMDQFKAAGSFGDDRRGLLDAAAGRTFDIVVLVDRVEWTLSFEAADGYDGGRTIVGKLQFTGDTDNDHSATYPAAVRMPASLNDTIDTIRPGQTYHARGRIRQFDTLYDRAEFEGVASDNV